MEASLSRNHSAYHSTQSTVSSVVRNSLRNFGQPKRPGLQSGWYLQMDAGGGMMHEVCARRSHGCSTGTRRIQHDPSQERGRHPPAKLPQPRGYRVMLGSPATCWKWCPFPLPACPGAPGTASRLCHHSPSRPVLPRPPSPGRVCVTWRFGLPQSCDSDCSPPCHAGFGRRGYCRGGRPGT